MQILYNLNLGVFYRNLRATVQSTVSSSHWRIQARIGSPVHVWSLLSLWCFHVQITKYLLKSLHPSLLHNFPSLFVRYYRTMLEVAHGGSGRLASLIGTVDFFFHWIKFLELDRHHTEHHFVIILQLHLLTVSRMIDHDEEVKRES